MDCRAGQGGGLVDQMTCGELFVGAGGLAMGCGAAGFSHLFLVEYEGKACYSINSNRDAGVGEVAGWPFASPQDATKVCFKAWKGRIDLLAGGPPCQPFSLGGQHKGSRDDRNMFPQMVRAMRECRPRAVIIENVKGILRSTFKKWFDYTILSLSKPVVYPLGPGETHAHHAKRIRKSNKRPMYRPYHRLFNAADYGVPQCRERVFIVLFRDDVPGEFKFPEPTHSKDALIWDQWVDGGYWVRHNLPKPQGRPPARAAALAMAKERPKTLPWVTVRDALAGLPDPTDAEAASKFINHEFRDGARSYPGHTGSPLDMPAKTLKAGVHGVPGGENMMVKDDGGVRYFTVRECARLQSFPDEYGFHGSWSDAVRQIGNAVPVRLAAVVASAVRDHLVQVCDTSKEG